MLGYFLGVGFGVGKVLKILGIELRVTKGQAADMLTRSFNGHSSSSSSTARTHDAR